MATRKRARSAPAAAPQAAAPDPAPPAPPAPTEQEPPAGTPAAPARPVTGYRIASPPPTRAGGYVLTERGWVLDPDPEQNGG